MKKEEKIKENRTMVSLKVEHLEVLPTSINITFIDDEGLIYHFNINKEDLIPCDEGCNS